MKLSNTLYPAVLDEAIHFINDDKVKDTLYSIANKLVTGVDRRHDPEPTVMAIPTDKGIACLIITGLCKPLLLASEGVTAYYGELVANASTVVVHTDMHRLDDSIDVIVAKYHLHDYLTSKKKGGGESISIGAKNNQWDVLPVTITNGVITVRIAEDLAKFTTSKVFDTHILTLKEVQGRLHSDMFVLLLKYVSETFDAVAWFDTLGCPIENKEIKWSKYAMSINNGLFGISTSAKL